MERATFHLQIFAGATTGNSTVLGPGVLSRIRELAIYVVFGVGTTAGVVEIEGAYREDFTGTWSNIATVSWAAADRVHLSAVTGVHQAVRLRVSTTVLGGTMDAYALGN